MVRYLKRGHGLDKGEQDDDDDDDDELCDAALRQAHGQILEGAGWNGPEYDENVFFHSQGAGTGCSSGVGPRSGQSKDGGSRHGPPSDMELMKERFAKLLLGEDMSGGGKGVSSALALSNAITNLAASVFGEQYRLEPMSAERKARWRKEVDWLLSVTDYIVQLVPSQQISKDGSNMEIMITQQRKDLQMNIPALRKLDAMLIGYLDNFKDQNEFWYASRDANESERGNAKRKDDKWWLPTVIVPQNGLSEASRRWLHCQKESVHQVLKAAMAINAQVIMEMEVPEVYIESLPKNGRSSLGVAIYRSITDDDFDSGKFLESMDLSTEHKVLDLKDRIEASTVIWKRKMHYKECKSSWGSAVSFEKRELFEDRAETILLLIRHRFPGIPQTSLDICKIQYNRDVGQSILESYSRVLESLAFTVMSRIDDVLHADSLAQGPSHEDSNRRQAQPDATPANKLDPKQEVEKMEDDPSLKTLSDCMGWNFEPEPDTEKKNSWDKLKKLPNVEMAKKMSYIEKVEHVGGMRSPTARH